ncbi:MAG: hypothetical protein K6T57_01600 [Thermaceae bacterium]|nr:hypothetical protein [Thermaceae bacterium]
MRRLIIELEASAKRSLTPVSGERLEAALRRYAVHLRGLQPVRVFIQEYDPRLSSKFRYTPAPQLLQVLLRELKTPPPEPSLLAGKRAGRTERLL